MKSDRRHALQENELASYLGRINTAIEPYSKLIVVVLAALVLAVVALGVYQSQTSATRSDATLQLLNASASGDPEVLAEVAMRYPDTAAGAWAALYQGNQHMAEGMAALYRDEALVEEQFEQARAAFRVALDRGSDRVLRSRAHLGLARIAESLGEIDQAVEQYRQVIAVDESEAMVEMAQQRIDALSDPQTQEFLAWFGEQDFSPADPSLPPSLPSDAALPDVPDMELPDLGQDAGESGAPAGESPIELQDPLNLQGGDAAPSPNADSQTGTGTEDPQTGTGTEESGTDAGGATETGAEEEEATDDGDSSPGDASPGEDDDNS